MRLLIAFDGSEYAKAAVRDLRRSGIPGNAAAAVVAVSEVMASSLDIPAVDPLASRRTHTAVMLARKDAADAMREARELADAAGALVKTLFPTWDVECSARLGDPGQVIVTAARDRRTDLVVVGARGRSTLGRLLLGSVSQYVATHSTASVLVSRQVPDRDHAPVRIMIGIDGSSSSRTAVETVAARSWDPATEMLLTAVATTHRASATLKQVSTAAAWVADSNQARRETVRASLERCLTVLADAGLRVSGDVVEGVAHRILCERAAEFGADSIFVGGRSFSSEVGPTAPSDVMTALVTSAPCSVEIVR